MIAIIDYNMGNLFSVTQAVSFIGREWRIIDNVEDLKHFQYCILPGVGNFGLGMEELRSRNFEKGILQYAAEGKKLLGICMGMQMLLDSSEEAPGVKGLGLIKGKVLQFDRNAGEKVPQMGWNQVEFMDKNNPFFKGVADKSYFYFVHSYYAKVDNPANSLGETEFITRYSSIVGEKNILGYQFHPEKSSDAGITLLRNFFDK